MDIQRQSTTGDSMLDWQDRSDIEDLVNLYGHHIDLREWDKVVHLFTPDAIFDSTDTGGARVQGIDSMLDRWQKSRNHPLAHHAMNIVISEDADGEVRVISKGLAVGFKGRVGSVTYRDVVVKTPQGWRIAERSAHLMRPQPRPEPE